jgi:hypothetical protein
MIKNVFEIPNAANRNCLVLGYTRSHSMLEIEVEGFGVEDREAKMYVRFSDVQFFEGPMVWTSADFHMSDDTECLALLKKLRRYPDIADSFLVEHFKLFVVSGLTLAKMGIEVRILAQGGGIYRDQNALFGRSGE